MPRLARPVFAEVPHHITQRGNRREDVFFNDADRAAYLAWLKEYGAKHGVRVLAYCLMTNHVHVVAVPEKPDGNQRGQARVIIYFSVRRPSVWRDGTSQMVWTPLS